MQYVDYAYYKNVHHGILLSKEEADKYLERASEQANLICRGRIEGIGFEGLSSFRQNEIKKFVCYQAEFLFQNEDLLQTYLNSYSINGVSMQFGNSWNLHVESGLAMPRELYQRLLRTGLCYRGWGYYE